jgi:positive regulator of sigma E activity
MLEEDGIVIKTRGDTAWVQVEKKSACATCSAAHVCHPPDQDCLEADNHIGAVKGQRVRIVVDSNQYVIASLLLYGIPVVVFITTAICGKLAAVALAGETYSDFWAFVAACLGTGLTFALVIRWQRNRPEGQKFNPVITEILTGES